MFETLSAKSSHHFGTATDPGDVSSTEFAKPRQPRPRVGCGFLCDKESYETNEILRVTGFEPSPTYIPCEGIGTTRTQKLTII